MKGRAEESGVRSQESGDGTGRGRRLAIAKLESGRIAPDSRLLTPDSHPRSPGAGAFTLLEILLALALTGLVLLSLNLFVFSMGELWGKNTDVRLFDRHVRAVTRFLDGELRSASLPPAAVAGSTPVAPQEIRPQTGITDNLITFELPQGSRILNWPDRPLPEVVCSLQVREREGLYLLWHSRLEKRFADDPPRETLITPLVTALSYEYYDTDFKTWKTETTVRKDNNGALETPQRLRLKFTYGKLVRETVIVLTAPTAGMPNF